MSVLRVLNVPAGGDWGKRRLDVVLRDVAPTESLSVSGCDGIDHDEFRRSRQGGGRRCGRFAN